MDFAAVIQELLVGCDVAVYTSIKGCLDDAILSTEVFNKEVD
jgi:hypothetical protein